ncbi:MAG: hypothetical protein CK425_02635 [Parachlamydia sp.]|nr:MAG: hypothetical protein CK425_02635 [Parachlamydia sp.]
MNLNHCIFTKNEEVSKIHNAYFHGPTLDQIRTTTQSKLHQMAIESKEKMGYPALVSATVR